MRTTAWMLLGVVATMAAAKGDVTFTFQTVLHADGPAPDGAAGVVDGVQQVVLQDGNNNIATLGTVNGNFAIVHSTPSGGGFDTSLIVQAGDGLYGGGGSFDDLQNLALTSNSTAGSRLTFTGLSGSIYGIFQYDVEQPSPEHRVIVEGDPFEFQPIDLNGSLLGGVAHQVKSDGNVLFAGGAGGRELVIGADASALTKIADSTAPATDVLSSFASPPAKWAYTASGQAAFIATHEYAPSLTRTDVVSINGALAGPDVRFPGGQVVDGKSYTPTMMLGATDDDALFRAQATDGSQAILIARNGAYKVLGAYDAADAGLLRPDAILTENRRVAMFVPDASGGSVKFYNSQSDGPVITLAALGTDLTDDVIPWEIKNISIIDFFAPMVNDNDVVVFDAQIAPESGPNANDWKDALLAWWPSLSRPVIVAKVDDLVEIGGNPETISAIFPNVLATPMDGSIYKDALNNQNYLALGVAYADGSKTAVLLTQVPEPATASVIVSMGLACIVLRRGRRR